MIEISLLFLDANTGYPIANLSVKKTVSWENNGLGFGSGQTKSSIEETDEQGYLNFYLTDIGLAGGCYNLNIETLSKSHYMNVNNNYQICANWNGKTYSKTIYLYPNENYKITNNGSFTYSPSNSYENSQIQNQNFQNSLSKFFGTLQGYLDWIIVFALLGIVFIFVFFIYNKKQEKIGNLPIGGM